MLRNLPKRILIDSGQGNDQQQVDLVKKFTAKKRFKI